MFPATFRGAVYFYFCLSYVHVTVMYVIQIPLPCCSCPCWSVNMQIHYILIGYVWKSVFVAPEGVCLLFAVRVLCLLLPLCVD